MNVKLIALDMDGTLLDANHVDIPRRNVEALRAAAAQGTIITLASGRTMYLLRDAVRALGVVKYALVSNGAGVLDVTTGEWISHLGLPEAQARAILKVFYDYGVAVETYADGMSYLTERDLAGADMLGFSDAFLEDFANHVTVVDDVVAAVAGKTIEKLHALYVNPSIRGAVMAALAELGPMAIANAEPANLEITAPGADKGKALERLCDKLGILPENVMSFGDADNDLEMLAWAGMSFAMGNGTPKAKAAAKYVTAPNYEAGVAQAIEQYL